MGSTDPPLLHWKNRQGGDRLLTRCQTMTSHGIVTNRLCVIGLVGPSDLSGEGARMPRECGSWKMDIRDVSGSCCILMARCVKNGVPAGNF
ncbi:MAG: hypothetical protein HOP32_07055 [Nitrospira sp.]|nr:hypothetical protein [Nitrospira sp.]